MELVNKNRLEVKKTTFKIEAWNFYEYNINSTRTHQPTMVDNIFCVNSSCLDNFSIFGSFPSFLFF